MAVPELAQVVAPVLALVAVAVQAQVPVVASAAAVAKVPESEPARVAAVAV